MSLTLEDAPADESFPARKKRRSGRLGGENGPVAAAESLQSDALGPCNAALKLRTSPDAGRAATVRVAKPPAARQAAVPVDQGGLRPSDRTFAGLVRLDPASAPPRGDEGRPRPTQAVTTYDGGRASRTYRMCWIDYQAKKGVCGVSTRTSILPPGDRWPGREDGGRRARPTLPRRLARRQGRARRGLTPRGGRRGRRSSPRARR
jgi:hypothetical protein